MNIGAHCSDRICTTGRGGATALIWENAQGRERTYTYDKLRVLSNTFAGSLRDAGVARGDRVCLFMDRVPELYVGFLAALKLGAIAQPLFSAFGEESLWTRLDDAGTAVVVTQKKHLGKVRRIREKLPSLRRVVVVDAPSSALRAEEIPLALDALARVDRFEAYPTTAETPSVLHYTSGTTGQPKGALHVHGSIVGQYLTAKWVLLTRSCTWLLRSGCATRLRTLPRISTPTSLVS